MKVTIDREDCTACGVCWNECPEIFEQSGEDDLSRITKKYSTVEDGSAGDVPDNLEDCARQGADGCPVEVIHVEG